MLYAFGSFFKNPKTNLVLKYIRDFSLLKVNKCIKSISKKKVKLTFVYVFRKVKFFIINFVKYK